MDIQREDVASVLITLCLLAAWYMTLTVFNRPLLSVVMLWTGMILLSLIYYIVYRKRQRDLRIFKIRFLVSAIPIYPALAWYVYILLTGTVVTGILRLLPIGIIGTMLLLNALVVYWYT